MREVDEQELLSMLRNMAEGNARELEKMTNPLTLEDAQCKGYYEGRRDAWAQLHKVLLRELAGEAEAPRFFQPLAP